MSQCTPYTEAMKEGIRCRFSFELFPPQQAASSSLRNYVTTGITDAAVLQGSGPSTTEASAEIILDYANCILCIDLYLPVGLLK